MKVYIHRSETGYVLNQYQFPGDVEIDIPTEFWGVIQSAFRIYGDVQDYLGVVYHAKGNN